MQPTVDYICSYNDTQNSSSHLLEYKTFKQHLLSFRYALHVRRFSNVGVVTASDGTLYDISSSWLDTLFELVDVVVDYNIVYSSSNGPDCPQRLRRHLVSSTLVLLQSNVSLCRTTTVLPDGRTLRVVPSPVKGEKDKLDQGRLRESWKELEVSFDRVLGESAGQGDVYDQVKACVRLPFAGENVFPMIGVPCCIFQFNYAFWGSVVLGVHSLTQIPS